MAIDLALCLVRRSHAQDVLPDSVLNQLLSGLNLRWRERLLTPVRVLRLFLLQILCANTSITHLRQLSGIDFAPASYCEARSRLSLRLLRRLLYWTLQQAHAMCGRSSIGGRIIAADCTSASMSDTPALRERFGLPLTKNIKAGVSYPILKLATLIDLTTGCILRMITTPLYVHEASGVLRLARFIRAGDIVLGDRAFCSFVHFCLLQARGAFGCFRLHQMRKPKGTRIERWSRPSNIPKWINRAFFFTLPEFIDVRIVSYRVARAGFRTHHVVLATTLTDEHLWPDGRIAGLYGHRWQIETCFNHLKTTMRMCVLKCQSIAGVKRELLMYQITYNLVRLTMLRHAIDTGIRVNRVSLIDAMRWLWMRLIGLPGVSRLIQNPQRPGRYHPRVRRRRMKEYDLLTQPRATRIARDLRG
jgi:hypothetical protein